jgi:hypothetical protein
VGVVNEAVQDGIGIGGIADQFVPAADGDLAGDQGRALPITIFKDFEQVVPGIGIEVLKPQSSRMTGPHEQGSSCARRYDHRPWRGRVHRSDGVALRRERAIIAARPCGQERRPALPMPLGPMMARFSCAAIQSPDQHLEEAAVETAWLR